MELDTRGRMERSPLVLAINAALDARDVKRAQRICSERIEQAPDDAQAHRCLAVLSAQSGARAIAIAAGRRACELAPDDPKSWCGLGQVYAILNELSNAAQCFGEAVNIDARDADAWHNLGTALKQLRRPQAAIAALKNALLIDATRADTYLNLGTLFSDAGRFEDAVECFDRAFKYEPGMAASRSRLGWQLSTRGKVTHAESLFRQALTMDPGHIEGWLGLGRTLEDLGEAEGARSAYLNVLRLRPDHAMALGQYLALLRDEKRSSSEADAESGVWVSRAEGALRDDAVQDAAKALIGYGVAKYHDRSGNYEGAARAARVANAARRRVNGPLDRGALGRRVDGLIQTYTAAFFAERRRFGLGTDQPVFVVGLPRSGTTLTEQILAAHPMMHGSGELPTLGRLAARRSGKQHELWQAATLLDEVSSRTIGGDYLRELRDGAPKGLLRISDKSPLNYFQLAFAAVLFPGARVVHCRRAAADNALSIWMENFGADQCYATDFDDLAFFRAEYLRLMAHWREVLPLKMLEIRYEDTVADLDGQARRLIEFLDVPWDEACLQFHNSDRAVQTPSRWQVRQPIYSRSVERWKAYVDQLPELSALSCEK